MFKMHGYMGRGNFLRAAALRFGLFAASVIGFPFLLMAIAKSSGCAGIGGACGALGLVVATAVKPLAFILLLFSLVGISSRRASDAGLPSWVGLAIPAFLGFDYNYFVYHGAPWTFAFSAGILSQTAPRFALLALYFIGIMAILPSRVRRARSSTSFRLAGFAAAGLGVFLFCTAVPGLAMGIVGTQPWVLQLLPMLHIVGALAPYAMVGLVAILGWLAWQYRKAPADEDAPAVACDAEEASHLPIGGIFAAAFMLSIVVCAYTLSVEMQSLVLLALVANFSAIILPTSLIYFLPMLATWRLVTRPGLSSAILLFLALAPIALWGCAHYTTFSEQQREWAEIAAIPTTAMPHLVSTLVLEGDHTPGVRAALAMPQIHRAITKSSYGSQLSQFERPGSNPSVWKQSSPTALPEEYILLRVGRSSGFAKKGQIYAAAGGPFELRHVDASHNDLLAVWYRAYNPSPSVLPVLTSGGWYRGSNTTTSAHLDAKVSEFLATAFKNAI
jgi:uncharacterized membrane protein YhaH (DUF805 family)